MKTFLKLTIACCCLVMTSTALAQWNTTTYATHWYSTNSGNVGVGTTAAPSAKLEIAASGDGVSILRLSTERAWSFMQDGTGAGANLTLKDLTGSKIFRIKDYDGQTSFSVSPSIGYFRGSVGIGASPSAAVMVDIAGARGNTDQRNFRVTYPTGGQLLNTEFSALTHLSSELNLGWTALYAKAGTSTSNFAGVFNGKTAFLNGNVGIGTSNPVSKLHVSGGHMVLEVPGSNPTIFTGTGQTQHNNYLTLANSPEAGYGSASGLKAGGILVSDLYSYANPGKNDMIVKGNVSIGTNSIGNFKLHANGNTRFGGVATVGHSGGHYDEFGYNVGFTSTNDQYTYVVTDRAASIRMGYQGSIEFRTTDTGVQGTAGSPLTLTSKMVVKENGNVGIGTTSPDTKLTVKGIVHTNEVRVDVNSPIEVGDYVFENDYKLMPLTEIEVYVKENKHLPEVPSAQQFVDDGLNLKEMNLLLLKKVEELTLHLIELNAEVTKLKAQGNCKN